ncbi:MAG: response regulator transcription factor [Verrucomicrobiota bacterium]
MPSTLHILVAEDDPHTREALVTILEQDGFQVTATPDGESAWTAFKNSPPDLVCLDVMMPGLDGYEVCRRIRKTNEHIPLLFLTAKSEEIDTVVGLELGADDYVAKPFGVREILARIHAILRRTRLLENKPDAPTRYQMHDLTIIPTELRGVRDETEITLSLRDLKILQLLHDHPNQVLTRDHIYNHAWGYDHMPNSRSLDQHISQLRKKIESNPANPTLIQTVHGVGYRYEPSQNLSK